MACSRWSFCSVVALSLATFSCRQDTVAPDPPVLGSVSSALNRFNNLSLLTIFADSNADSARVLYWVSGDPQQATPFRLLHSGTDTVAILGLRPNALYNQIVEIVGRGGVAQSDTIQFSSGDLPAALQGVHLAVTGSSGPGYTLTAGFILDTAFVLAFDSSGQIRWYRAFGEGVPPGETKQQANGNFTVFLGATTGWQPTYGRFVEFRPSGEVVQNYVAGGAYYTDEHEFFLTAGNGTRVTAYQFGYDYRFLDLSPYGGPSSATVAAHALIRQTDGVPEVLWDSWDYFTPDDEILSSPGDIDGLDLDHPNSLDFDSDGNYIISMFRVASIVKVDHRSNTVIWQFGGKRNQFTIVGDPLGGFGGQHCVRILPNGHLLLYDNGEFHNPPESRAVEYELDPVNKTATLVWEFRHNPAIYTQIVGSVQRLANGDTFVGFGQAGHMTEAAKDGSVVWEADFVVNGTTPLFYRSIRVASLYKYTMP